MLSPWLLLLLPLLGRMLSQGHTVPLLYYFAKFSVFIKRFPLGYCSLLSSPFPIFPKLFGTVFLAHFAPISVSSNQFTMSARYC